MRSSCATRVSVLFCLFLGLGLVQALYNPNGGTELQLGNSIHSRNDDEQVCGTGQMYYTWNRMKEDHGGPRALSEIYFYYNGTFVDNTYQYTGEWIEFGITDDILMFHYESAQYYAPYNNATGSMYSHTTMCGYWFMEGFKWYCPSTCGTLNTFASPMQ